MLALHPLSNFVAVYERDPAARASLRDELGERFERIRTRDGWIWAERPLPGAEAGAHVAEASLVFAEGAGLVAATPQAAISLARRAHAAPDGLAALPGDFAFCAMGPEGRAVAARSCGGAAPVYVFAGASRVVVGTLLHEVARAGGAPMTIDALAMTAWIAVGVFPDRRTFLEGIGILERGEFARVAPGAPPRFGRYWDPRPAGPARRTREDVEERRRSFRTILLGALETDLDPSGPSLLTLSGGVDSSALGALATRALGRRITTLTFLPPDPVASARERGYVDALHAECRFERRVIRTLSLADRVRLLSGPVPAPFPVVHPALLVLPELEGSLPPVLLGGEIADEVCGSSLTFADWIESTGPLALVGRPRHFPGGRSLLKAWAVGRARMARGRPAMPHPWARTLPRFVRPEAREQFDEWAGRQSAILEADDRPGRHTAVHLAEDGFRAMNWEACSALGMRRSFPFGGRAMLELTASCHPRELVGPGTKRITRAALAGDVPPNLLERADKGRWPDEALDPAALDCSLDLDTVGALSRVVDPGIAPESASDVLQLVTLMTYARRVLAEMPASRAAPRNLARGLQVPYHSN